jgi:hypothetical protein
MYLRYSKTEVKDFIVRIVNKFKKFDPSCLQLLPILSLKHEPIVKPVNRKRPSEYGKN